MVDPGEGSEGPAPLFFSIKMRPEGPKKIFFETGPPPYLTVWMTAPPPPSPYLKDWMGGMILRVRPRIKWFFKTLAR